MKSTASFLSAQPEVAQQFLSNTRFSLKAADTPADKYDVILNVSRSFAEGFAPAVAPFKEWLEMVKSAEEEYMPSGPPMSPVTHKFFLQWSITDLRFGPGNETLADCVKALLSSVKATKADRLTLSLISQITSSRIGIYEVMKSDARQTQLQDIVSEEVFVCEPLSAKKGTLWLTRVLPYPEDDTHHFVAIEPYVLQGHTRVEWLRILQQQAAGHGITVEELLKFGHAGLSWLEYLLQSYLGFKDGFIQLAGNLTDPRTRAHSNGEGLAPRYRATGLALPVFEFQLTPAQRKLVAKEFPEMEPELQLKKSGRQPVALNPESLLRLREFVSIYTRAAKGAAAGVGLSLALELDERIEELGEVLDGHWGKDDEDACEWLAEAKDLLFKFTLEDTGVEVVRYVKVPAHYDLKDLHNLLQVAFGWESSHLHLFDIDGDRFTDPEAPVEECYDEEDVELSRAFSHSLQGVYLYDMGDSWEVSMQILRGYQQGDGLPLLVAGSGPNAVEDCGGTPGFEELLRLLKNPRLKDPHDLRDMVDDSYDPVECPSEDTQRRLIEAFRDDWAEEGELLYIKRHPAEGFSVQGKPTDVVIAVESEELTVIGCKAYLRSDGPEVALEVVREALSKVRAPDTLVVDDKDLAKVLKKNIDLKVRVRKSIPELGPVLGELESYMSRPYAYFEHIPQDILADFLQTAHHYYLHPLWTQIPDGDLMLLEGLTPQPLLLSILGYSGAEFGLSVFEDISAAEAMLEERPMDTESFFFLTFHDDWQAMQMRRQIEERGLPTLPDSAPLILTPQRFGGAREYRLMTDILSLLSRYKAPGPKVQTFGSVTVTWPISPSDLHKLKSKFEETANIGKLGRNDPCWCGSGKKYKKCHLGKD